VIIEDVAFPIERLAEATLELQDLLQRHGYEEAIIFGHALEGNLHFVFTQDFSKPAEVERYRRFMDESAGMVVTPSTTARSRPSTAPAATWPPSSSWNGARTPIA
jgi:D-lactate dehydrogenase